MPQESYQYPLQPIYTVDPWRTTYVPHHYPVKHPRLDSWRHAFGETMTNVSATVLHPFAPEQPIHNPRADVRESRDNYYVEIELPGLESKENLIIKWLDPRTFIVELKLGRPEISEEPRAQVDGEKETKEKDEGPVLTVRERHIGLFARAFSFATDVGHEQLEANLHAGLLRIKVPKREGEGAKKELKEVEVKHTGT